MREKLPVQLDVYLAKFIVKMKRHIESELDKAIDKKLNEVTSRSLENDNRALEEMKRYNYLICILSIQ